LDFLRDYGNYNINNDYQGSNSNSSNLIDMLRVLISKSTVEPYKNTVEKNPVSNSYPGFIKAWNDHDANIVKKAENPKGPCPQGTNSSNTWCDENLNLKQKERKLKNILIDSKICDNCKIKQNIEYINS
jgi:hypothetical protein